MCSLSWSRCLSSLSCKQQLWNNWCEMLSYSSSYQKKRNAELQFQNFTYKINLEEGKNERERERSRITVVSPFFQRIVDTRQSHLDRKAQYHWFASLQYSVKVSFKWLPIEKFKIQAIHFMHTSWFLNWCYWCHYLINPAPAPASQKNTPPWPWYVLVKLYHLQYHERLHIAY